MMAKALSDWFVEQGVESMDLRTYKSHGSDVPVKDYLLRRAFGSWRWRHFSYRVCKAARSDKCRLRRWGLCN